MKVTYIERSPGTWRLRIESGVGPDGRRLFKYETLRGTLDDVRRRRFAILAERARARHLRSTRQSHLRRVLHAMDRDAARAQEDHAQHRGELRQDAPLLSTSDCRHAAAKD